AFQERARAFRPDGRGPVGDRPARSRRLPRRLAGLAGGRGAGEPGGGGGPRGVRGGPLPRRDGPRLLAGATPTGKSQILNVEAMRGRLQSAGFRYREAHAALMGRGRYAMGWAL